MHTCVIINIKRIRNNVAFCLTEKHDVQEIPTPQGFLVIQICATTAQSTLTAAPLIDIQRVKTMARGTLIFL
jgi:hypothetical protein